MVGVQTRGAFVPEPNWDGPVSSSMESRAAAFDMSPVPVVVHRGDGVPTDANRAYRQLVGLGLDDPVGLGVWDRLHDDDRAAVADAWHRFRHRLPFDAPVEFRILDAHGRWRWMLSTAATLPGHDEVILTLIDVTARREAEARVATVARYNQALLDQAADIITVLEADGSWRSSSPQGTTILGFPRGYDPPGGILDLVHPHDRAIAAQALADVVGEDAVPGRPVELRIATAGGDYRRFEVVGVNLLDDPVVAGVVVSARDVTERHEAWEAQAATEQRYRELVDRMHEGLWVIDHEGVTTFVNPRTAEMLRTTPEEMMGTHLFAWIDVDNRSCAAELLAGRRAGRSEVHEFTFRRSDGTALDALVSTSPTVRDGTMVEAVAVIADISGLKATEAELSAALERAEAANAAKSVFLSHVSHELRTPLSSVVGYAALLRGSSDPDAAACAERIGAAGRHLARLIDDLLDITRLESAQAEVATTTVPLAEAVTEAVALAAVPAGRLRNLVDGGSVRADRKRLVQVLVNLLGNALRHGPAGGTVTVRADRSGHAVRVSVVDEGPGVAPADAERIFDPFVQLGPAGPGTRPGSGLGLPISRGLMEAMGGTLRVEPGAPTCFTLELPSPP